MGQSGGRKAASQQPSDSGMAKQRSDVHYCAQNPPRLAENHEVCSGGKDCGPGRGVMAGPLACLTAFAHSTGRGPVVEGILAPVPSTGHSKQGSGPLMDGDAQSPVYPDRM